MLDPWVWPQYVLLVCVIDYGGNTHIKRQFIMSYACQMQLFEHLREKRRFYCAIESVTAISEEVMDFLLDPHPDISRDHQPVLIEGD